MVSGARGALDYHLVLHGLCWGAEVRTAQGGEVSLVYLAALVSGHQRCTLHDVFVTKEGRRGHRRVVVECACIQPNRNVTTLVKMDT